jgi:hypothetical protein
MHASNKRRRGWNYDEPAVSELPRPRIRDQESRHSSGSQSLLPALIVLIGILTAAGFVFLHAGDFNRFASAAVRIAESAVARIASRFLPLRQASPSPETVPLPATHNSTDTECESGRPCTDEEFASLLDSLRRQWALTPQEIQAKCVSYSTYPTVEHCVLTETVSWLAKHPNEAAPWINPKNFDTEIMTLCEKDPKSLPLCTKP